MIKSFRHKGLEEFFFEDLKRGIRPEHVKKLSRILEWLDVTGSMEELQAPDYGLHPLKGNLKGSWAVKASGNWRVVFEFENGNAYLIDYLDYH